MVRARALLSMRHLTLFSLPCFAVAKVLSKKSAIQTDKPTDSLCPHPFHSSQISNHLEDKDSLQDNWPWLPVCNMCMNQKCQKWSFHVIDMSQIFFLYSLTRVWWLTAWKVVPWGLTQSTSWDDHNRDCCFKVASYSLWFFGVGISNVILSRITF